MLALLDVNVLIALFDVEHTAHQRAQQWLRANVDAGWATCPITQNGVIRIMSHPAYPRATSTEDMTVRLRAATADPSHRFLSDSISLTDERRVRSERLLTAAITTDIYLLALAVANHARLVTFDRNVSLRAVVDATAAHLEVL